LLYNLKEKDMCIRHTVSIIDGRLVFGSEVVNALPQMSVQVARYLCDEGNCTEEAYKDFVMSEDPNFKLKMIKK
jgi:hypothetical protein